MKFQSAQTVEGLLDAVGFIFNVTVGRSSIMETLGINRIIDSGFRAH
ncbi:MAG: hypothetical protein MRJ52_03205 [Nitrosomonas sp.]|nr:hypothetical protein [Nitrosomonas sp.]